MKRSGQLVLAFVFMAAFSTDVLAQPPTPGDPAVKEQMERGKKDLQERKYKDALDAFKNANKMQHNSCGECYFFHEKASNVNRSFWGWASIVCLRFIAER